MTSSGRDDPEKLPSLSTLLETYYVSLAQHGKQLGLGSDRDDALSSARSAALSAILGMLAAEKNGKEIGNPRAYLRRAISNKAIDHIRKKARRTATLQFTHEPAESAICTRGSYELESRLDLFAAIQSELSENEKIVIELYYQDGKRTAEIAEILEVSAATVHRILRAATGQLHKKLSEDPQS